jgi:hypothetical protein
MLINANLSTETALASRQNPRTVAGPTASQTASAASNATAATELDPSLQRLTDLPVGAQDSEREIQDQQGAGQTLESLRQTIMGQSQMAMAAQANQLSPNVLGLLQSTE